MTGTGDQAGLSIAQLASLTGVAEATLRVWEARHGVPAPRRLANGHRRYSRAEVALVRAAVDHRRAGMSVAAALARARSTAVATPASIFAALREARPELAPQAMEVGTLAGVSRAIEDECLTRASAGLLIGAFQREPFYRRAEPRWQELAVNMELTIVLADFERRRTRARRPNEIPLAPRSPMHREWGVIAPAGCLLARERPQRCSGGGSRVFDAIWSPEPGVVHAAATIAISMLGEDGLAQHATAVLGPAPAPSPPELRHAAALTNRIVGYLGGARPGSWG